jgi:hypothetical protein
MADTLWGLIEQTAWLVAHTATGGTAKGVQEGLKKVGIK